MKLELHAVHKTFKTNRGETCALEDIDLEVDPGAFVCLLGPSGCGKSTLLNLIAGLDRPDQGTVWIDGRPVGGPGRDRVVIFQEAALFPWLNVRDNIGFGLSLMRLPQPEQKRRVDRALDLVRLTGFGQAFVHELSGGMKQRAALARALVLEPDVLLMDEPFAALDAQTRDMLHDELQSIWAQTGTTILFVTHNVREALVLGDRVVLMTARPGRIKREFGFALPRPRHIEDQGLVDASRVILADLRAEVTRATTTEVPNGSLGA